MRRGVITRWSTPNNICFSVPRGCLLTQKIWSQLKAMINIQWMARKLV